MVSKDRIYYKVTLPSGEYWCCSGMDFKNDPAKTCEWVQKQADTQGLGTKYEIITRAEYDAYYDQDMTGK